MKTDPYLFLAVFAGVALVFPLMPLALAWVWRKFFQPPKPGPQKNATYECGMFAISGLAVTLFLGGWHAPLPFLEIIPSYVWFFAKLAALLFVFIWIRGTLPRMRIDHVMNFAWKFMMPMAFTCIVAAAAWHYQRQSVLRWVWSLGILLVVYLALSRFLRTGKNLSVRTYRFAE